MLNMLQGPAVVNTVNRKRSARRFERHAKREAFAQKH